MTRVRPALLVSLPLFLFAGCIERYYPEGEEFRSGVLVVIAHLDNSSNFQSIVISRSTNLELPLRDPVSGCLVEVEEIGGPTLGFFEEEEGKYLGFTAGQFFRSGRAYKLRIVTPNAGRYESEPETMYPSPAIDSVYWVREEHPTENPLYSQDGIQFYMDYQIEKDSGRYLRWQLEETYEYQNPVLESVSIYGDGPVPREDLVRICWVSNKLPAIFTNDLGKVDGEVYRQMPLNYVTNHSQRLKFRYSLLVRQFALSVSAYRYWEGMKTNLQSEGGLYNSQPSLTPGNICNVDDENEIVIGFFSVSGVSEKRIFVSAVPGLNIILDDSFCVPGPIPISVTPGLRIYLATRNIRGESIYGTIQRHCFDCRENKNSVNTPPDFW